MARQPKELEQRRRRKEYMNLSSVSVRCPPSIRMRKSTCSFRSLVCPHASGLCWAKLWQAYGLLADNVRRPFSAISERTQILAEPCRFLCASLPIEGKAMRKEARLLLLPPVVRKRTGDGWHSVLKAVVGPVVRTKQHC